MMYRVIFMKLFRKLCIILFLSALTAFCMTDTELVREAVYEAVSRCLVTVIPSLYAMMTVSVLLTKSGMISCIPKFISKPLSFIFGMNGSSLSVFILSSFAGYPVGAKMLASQVSGGRLSRREAELLSGICFGAGPAFIHGCIACRLFSSHDAGITILISAVSANILLAAAISPFLRQYRKSDGSDASVEFSAEMLTESVIGSGRSMGGICCMITAFSVFTALLRRLGIISFMARFINSLTGCGTAAAEGIFRSFLDITAADSLPHGCFGLLPVIAALTSFGGVCVIMQVAAIAKDAFSLKPLILIRLAASALSFIICRLIMPFTLADTAVSAAEINVRLQSASSPLPSLALIAMTAALFCEYERFCKQ